MSEIVSARLMAADTPLCQACQESAGLCVSCADRDRSILPQLAQESWHKDAHTGPLGKNPPPAVLVELTKEERFEAKKKARANFKLRTQLAGGFTRVRTRKVDRAA